MHTARLENRYLQAFPASGLRHCRAQTAPAPRLVLANQRLAGQLGIPADWISGERGAALWTGNACPPGAVPIALAYAGHQFGVPVACLGDGRALLLGQRQIAVQRPDIRVGRYAQGLRDTADLALARQKHQHAATGVRAQAFLDRARYALDDALTRCVGFAPAHVDGVLPSGAAQHGGIEQCVQGQPAERCRHDDDAERRLLRGRGLRAAAEQRGTHLHHGSLLLVRDPSDAAQTEACATPSRTVSTSRVAGRKSFSTGRTTAAERTR